MKSKTKIKTKPKAKQKKKEIVINMNTDVFLELEGHVYVVEKDKKGKVISKDEIPGKDVLGCLIKLLVEAADVKRFRL